MDTILRACVVYGMLLLIFRIFGKRTLAQVTVFDLTLTLIISEAIQGALVAEDHSITNAFLLVVTLAGLNVLLAWVKLRFPALERRLEGLPVVLVDEGQVRQDRLDKELVDREDILEEARALQGIGRMDQIAYAVAERNGQISIIPKPEEKS